MVKVRKNYFAGETSSFIPHGKREMDRDKKKKENIILPIGQERISQSKTIEREKKRSEKIPRKEKNKRKY